MFAQLGLPIIVHGYFDLFDGMIQMVVFSMLTMINIKVACRRIKKLNKDLLEFKEEEE